MRRRLPDSIVAEKMIPVARGLDGSTAPGLALVPGGLTPTEAAGAWSLGSPAVKLFPPYLWAGRDTCAPCSARFPI